MLLATPALAGPCDVLVVSEGDWSGALAEAGLEPAVALEHCGARVVPDGDDWALVVRLAPGDERRTAVPAPTSAGARIDIAILAASLLASAEPPPEDEPAVALASTRRVDAVSRDRESTSPTRSTSASSPAAVVSPVEAVVDPVEPTEGEPVDAALSDAVVSDDDGPAEPIAEDPVEPEEIDPFDPPDDEFEDDESAFAADAAVELPADDSPRVAAPWLSARIAAFARPEARPTVHGGLDGGVLLAGHLAVGPAIDLQGPWTFDASTEDRGVAFALGGGVTAGWTPQYAPVAPRVLARFLVLARQWRQADVEVSTLVAPVLAVEGGLGVVAGPLTLEPHAQLRVDLRRTELIFPDGTTADLVPVAFSFGVTVRIVGKSRSS